MNKWTKEEDEVLRKNYGTDNRNLSMMLPNRTPSAIRKRAERLELSRASVYSMQTCSRETSVRTLMNTGTAPSEIDRLMGYSPGTARKLVVRRWARDKAVGVS